VRVIGDIGEGRFVSSVMVRLEEFDRTTREVGDSGTADANVPKSSSMDVVGVCRVTCGMYVGGLYFGGENVCDVDGVG
jgi:hypothetical protein